MKKYKQSEQKWQHPGGKLRELGADKLSDAELLAILLRLQTRQASGGFRQQAGLFAVLRLHLGSYGK